MAPPYRSVRDMGDWGRSKEVLKRHRPEGTDRKYRYRLLRKRPVPIAREGVLCQLEAYFSRLLWVLCKTKPDMPDSNAMPIADEIYLA